MNHHVQPGVRLQLQSSRWDERPSSLTPSQQPSGDVALLVITMRSSNERVPAGAV